MTIHLDLAALNEILYSEAKSSHILRSLRIALALGATSTISSAFARAPTKILPMKQPTSDFESRTNKLSKGQD